VGHANLEASVLFEALGDDVNDVRVVVDDEDFTLAAFEGIGGNAVVLHEAVQSLARNAAELRAGYAEALELAIVKAANDRLLTDLADLGGFASREDSFHATIPCRHRAGRTSGAAGCVREITRKPM